jgi:hypothetical protein
MMVSDLVALGCIRNGTGTKDEAGLGDILVARARRTRTGLRRLRARPDARTHGRQPQNAKRFSRLLPAASSQRLPTCPIATVSRAGSTRVTMTL